jgi:hypothetical protein
LPFWSASRPPTGLEVTSPAYITGRRSGSRREVDVAIRGQIGMTQLLIILECRDREGTEDVRWIEELASKKTDVGADRPVPLIQGREESIEAGGLPIKQREGIEIDQLGRDHSHLHPSKPKSSTCRHSKPLPQDRANHAVQGTGSGWAPAPARVLESARSAFGWIEMIFLHVVGIGGVTYLCSLRGLPEKHRIRDTRLLRLL